VSLRAVFSLFAFALNAHFVGLKMESESTLCRISHRFFSCGYLQQLNWHLDHGSSQFISLGFGNCKCLRSRARFVRRRHDKRSRSV
jgi:hypothetical protein